MAKRILIVEDENELARALQIRLEKAGFVTILASDGEEGLEKAKEEKPDLIILDIILPKRDGYSVCRKLKLDKEMSHIPIIMLSVKAQRHEIEEGYKNGASFYITKPFEIQTLLSQVEALLQK